MDKFFHMRDNTIMSKGWTRATKIYPESEIIQKNCLECGSVGSYPKGEFKVDIEGGTKYPDILLCGEYPLLIVSERVVDDWKKDRVKGFDYYRVEINKIFSKRLTAEEAPIYYHIVVNGRCELDLGKMDLNIKHKCKTCGHVTFDKPTWQANKFVIKESTWDGSDLFVSEIFPRIVICTEKVIVNACRNKHTNFLFHLVEDARKTDAPKIEYHKYCK